MYQGGRQSPSWEKRKPTFSLTLLGLLGQSVHSMGCENKQKGFFLKIDNIPNTLNSLFVRDSKCRLSAKLEGSHRTFFLDREYENCLRLPV